MPGRIASVTYRRQTAPAVFTNTTISQAWYRHKGTSEAESSSGGYLVDNYDWFFPVSENTGINPVPGDVIQYSGNSYTVGPDGVQLVGAQGAWRCATLQPRLNANLDDTITIRRYAAVKGDAGMFVRGAATVIASNLPCKIQESETFGIVAVGSMMIQGKNQAPRLANIFLSTPLEGMQPHDEIEDQNGIIYTFEADANVDRIGQFMSFQCRRIT